MYSDETGSVALAMESTWTPRKFENEFSVYEILRFSKVNCRSQLGASAYAPFLIWTEYANSTGPCKLHCRVLLNMSRIAITSERIVTNEFKWYHICRYSVRHNLSQREFEESFNG